MYLFIYIHNSIYFSIISYHGGFILFFLRHGIYAVALVIPIPTTPSLETSIITSYTYRIHGYDVSSFSFIHRDTHTPPKNIKVYTFFMYSICMFVYIYCVILGTKSIISKTEGDWIGWMLGVFVSFFFSVSMEFREWGKRKKGKKGLCRCRWIFFSIKKKNKKITCAWEKEREGNEG